MLTPGMHGEVSADFRLEFRRVKRIDCGMYLYSGVDRLNRVIFMCLRNSENRHNAVANKFVDSTSIPIHDSCRCTQYPLHDVFYFLRIKPFGHGGESRKVGEKDGRLFFSSTMEFCPLESPASLSLAPHLLATYWCLDYPFCK